MSLNTKYLSVIFLGLLLGASVSAQVFQAKEDFKNRAEMPAGILKILEKSELVKQCLDPAGFGVKNKFDATWFQASKIDLNDDGQTDYIVKGTKACLRNGNFATFWVIRNSSDGFRQVFKIGVAAIKIGNDKDNGFYDIYSFNSTPAITLDGHWSFDGHGYTARRTRENY